MIAFKDFWPAEYMFSAGLARLQPQVDAANAWIKATSGIRVVNVESLFDDGINVAGRVSNRTANGVRVWFVHVE